jgi:calcium-dependent protein kinase
MKCISKLGLKPEDVTKLLDEVNILKELDHPNIIKIYEFYQDKNKYYLITE